MKSVFSIVFLATILMGCGGDKKNPKDFDFEPFSPANVAKLIEYKHIGQKFAIWPWDTYQKDVDVLLSFPIDTLNQLYENHKIADSIITDADIYGFLDQTLISMLKYVSPRHRKYVLYDKTFSNMGLDYSSLQFSCVNSKDRLFLYSQVTCDSFMWNKQKIHDLQFISTKELKELICRNGYPVLRIDSIYQSKMMQNYGTNSYDLFSKPIFNRTKDFVIIAHQGQGSRDIFFYRKILGKWKMVVNEAVMDS